MKIKKWHIVVPLAFLIALVSIGLVGWTEIQERAMDFLLNEVRRAAGGHVELETAELGFRTIRLEGLKVTFAGLPGVLSIRNARLEYSWPGFLFSGFNVWDAVRRLTLFDPELVYFYGHDRVSSGKAGLSLDVLKTLGALGDLRFSGGRVFIKDQTTDLKPRVRLVHKLNGRIGAEDSHGISVYLGGETREGGDFRIEGSIDLSDHSYDLDLLIKSLDLTEAWFPLNSGSVLSVGEFDLNGRISRRDGRTTAQGEVSLSGGSVLFGDLRRTIEQVRLAGRVVDDTLFIRWGEGTYLGRPFQASGRLISLFEAPKMQIEARWADVDLGEAVARWRPEVRDRLAGYGTLQAVVEGPLDSLRVAGSLRLDRVSFEGWSFEEPTLQFRLDRSRLTAEHISGLWKGHKLEGSGRVDLIGRGRPLHVKLEIAELDMSLLGEALGVQRMEGIGDIEIEAVGDLERPNWLVYYKLQQFALGDYPLPDQAGWLRYEGGRARFETSGKYGSVSGSISSLFDRPSLSARLYLQSIPLQLSEDFKGDLFGQAEVTGDLTFLRTDGQFWLREGAGLSGGLSVRADLWDIVGSHRRGRVQVASDQLKLRGAPLDVDGEISLEDNRLRVDLSVGEGQIDFDGHISRADTTIEEGKVHIQNLSAWMLPQVLGLPSIGFDGRLSGELDLQGRISRPQMAGRLRLESGEIDGVEGLEAEVGFRWRDGVLDLQEGLLYQRDEQLVDLHGRWRWGGELDLQATIDGVEASIFSSLFDLGRAHPKGKISAGGRLSRKNGTSDIQVDLAVRNGELFHVPIDRLVARLKGDFKWLEIEHCEIERVGMYRGWARGGTPLWGASVPKGRELDLEMALEGNFLSFLPGATSIVRRASGTGAALVRIGGSWDDLKVTKAEAEFAHGSIRPAFLIDQIEQVAGRIRLYEDGFLEIELSGLAGSDTLSLRNLKEVGVDGESLPPIEVRDGVLNLGVLILGTSSDGVEVSIPPIMGSGGTGRLRPTGKTSGERFYIGGPSDAPKVRGRLEVYKTEGTYPFYELGPEEDRFELVDRMDWDLVAVAKQDVWYFSETVGGPGWAHGKIVENDSLEFYGSIEQDTFYVRGHVRTREGIVGYIDTEFRVVGEAGVEVDTKYQVYPRFYGKARTTVYDEITGEPEDIEVEIYGVDETTGGITDMAPWGAFRLRFIPMNPLDREQYSLDDYQEQAVEKLGYTSGRYGEKVIGAGLEAVENIYVRPLTRPIERKLGKSLGLDVVQIRPSIARNLMGWSDLWNGNSPLLGTIYGPGALNLLGGTRFVLGKHLASGLFLSYSGRVEAGQYGLEREALVLGVKHRVGLEYSIQDRTKLEIEYDYNDVLRDQDKDDKRIELRHEFDF